MNENLNHQAPAPAPAPAKKSWNWGAIAVVLVGIIGMVASAPIFVMSQDNKVRAENTAAIEKINEVLVEFKDEMFEFKSQMAEFKYEMDTFRKEFTEFRAEVNGELKSIKLDTTEIKNRLDTHDAKFIELEDKIEEVATSQ